MPRPVLIIPPRSAEFALRRRPSSAIREELGPPVSFTGSVILNSGDSAPVSAVENGLSEPVVVKEVKWALFISTAAFPNPLNGSIVDVSMSLGAEKITNAPVPLYALGPAVDLGLETLPNTNSGANSVGIATGAWRLDEPMLLLPGKGPTVKLAHRGLTPYAITAWFTLSGHVVRSRAARSNYRFLPYLAAFNPPAMTPTNGTLTDFRRESTEKDLVNTLSVPLRVKRLIGRLSILGQFGATGQASAASQDVADWEADLLRVQMRSSDGYAIAKDFVPYGLAFPLPNCALESPFVMRPGEYVKVRLEQTATADVNTSLSGGSLGLVSFPQLLPSITLVGYREVRP